MDKITVEEDIYDAVRSYRKNNPAMVADKIRIKANDLVSKFGKEAALEKVDGMIRLAIDFDYEEEVSHYHNIKSVIEQDYHNYLNSIQ